MAEVAQGFIHSELVDRRADLIVPVQVQCLGSKFYSKGKQHDIQEELMFQLDLEDGEGRVMTKKKKKNVLLLTLSSC